MIHFFLWLGLCLVVLGLIIWILVPQSDWVDDIGSYLVRFGAVSLAIAGGRYLLGKLLGF